MAASENPRRAPERATDVWACGDAYEGGVRNVQVRAIDVPTVFRDFDDFWTPFLGGQAPAPGYCMSLSEERRAALRDLVRSRLPVGADGTIRLIARAWAIRGLVP